MSDGLFTKTHAAKKIAFYTTAGSTIDLVSDSPEPTATKGPARLVIVLDAPASSNLVFVDATGTGTRTVDAELITKVPLYGVRSIHSTATSGIVLCVQW